MIRSYPKAIMHVDGDAFFASCEQAMNPALKGKPVVTGRERGIASSMSYEAKALGVTRGMPVHEITKQFPSVIIVPSNYEAYGLYSLRMYEIVRRYTEDVEEYSIDECFADLTGMRRVLRMSYPEMMHAIKRDLDFELGFTFSIGLAPTKQLAKIASKWAKPSGATAIPGRAIQDFLADVPVRTLWGVGPNTESYMHKLGLRTALDFASRDLDWVRSKFSKPFQDMWYELRGTSVMPVRSGTKSSYKTIGKTKTFTPPSREREFVFSQLSKNIEKACIKARRHGLVTNGVTLYLKTQNFLYHAIECQFEHSFSSPAPIVDVLEERFDEVFHTGVLYRATGVVLQNLRKGETQPDLFGETSRLVSFQKVFRAVDDVARKYGKHTLHLGSSFRAMHDAQHRTDRGTPPNRVMTLLPGETARKRLNIPFLGDVR